MKKLVALYILPFDHRGSFMKLIKAKTPPTKKDLGKAKEYKKIIYQAFLDALKTVPKQNAAILIDEWLGKDIIKDAKKRKIIVCNTFEKSGQKELQFERDYKQQLKEIKPDYAKILIRYDPKNKEINLRQAKKIKEFSGYLKNKKTRFLLEIITLDQKARTILKAIKQLHKKGVYPDVWKLEGVDKVRDMKKIVRQVKSQIVILGRGGDKKKVEHWLKTAAPFEKVIGFAIGRTIFARPLKDYDNKKLTKKQTINKISKNYVNFVKLFDKEKRGKR